jgi:hypothetical protein
MGYRSAMRTRRRRRTTPVELEPDPTGKVLFEILGRMETLVASLPI